MRRPALRFKIKKCVHCGRYTLKEKCPSCGEKTLIAHPARFSPDDKYLEYKIKSLLHSKGINI